MVTTDGESVGVGRRACSDSASAGGLGSVENGSKVKGRAEASDRDPPTTRGDGPRDGKGSVGKRIEAWYSYLTSQASGLGLQLQMRTETVTMATVAL